MLNIIADNFKEKSKLSLPLYDMALSTVHDKIDPYRTRDAAGSVDWRTGYRLLAYLIPEPSVLNYYKTLSNMDMYDQIISDSNHTLEHYDCIRTNRKFINTFVTGKKPPTELIVQMKTKVPFGRFPMDGDKYIDWQHMNPLKMLYSDEMVLPRRLHNLQLDIKELECELVVFGLDVPLMIMRYVKYLDSPAFVDKVDYITKHVLMPMLVDSSELWSLHLLDAIAELPDELYLSMKIDESTDVPNIMSGQLPSGITQLIKNMHLIYENNTHMSRLFSSKLTLSDKTILEMINEKMELYSLPSDFRYLGIEFLITSIYLEMITNILENQISIKKHSRFINDVSRKLNVMKAMNVWNHIPNKYVRKRVKNLILSFRTRYKAL